MLRNILCFIIIVIVLLLIGLKIFYDNGIQIDGVNRTMKTVPEKAVLLGDCNKISNSFNFTPELGFLPGKVLLGVRIQDESKDADIYDNMSGTLQILYKDDLIGTSSFEFKNLTCFVDIDKNQFGFIIYILPCKLNLMDEYTFNLNFKALPPSGTKLFLHGPVAVQTIQPPKNEPAK